jgi:hypothetical protein
MDKSALYSTLPSTGQHTRLLSVQKASDNAERLVCELKTVDLADADCPSFVALSYVWGDPSVGSAKIVLNNHSWEVGINLATALRYFRDQCSHDEGSTSGFIWVDALCINQADNDEKSIQVRQMDRIYRAASVVLSHLGSEGDGTDLALATLGKLSNAWQILLANCRLDSGGDSGEEDGVIMFDDDKVIDLFQQVSSTLTEQSWSSVDAFLSLPYWTRIWIVQEIVLGREILLVLGDSAITWTQLVNSWKLCLHAPNLLETLRTYQSEIWDKYKPSTSLKWDRIDLIGQLKGEGYHKMEGKVLPADLLKVLARSSINHATDSRDMIFGLGGICNLPVKPDYKQSVKDTFGLFAVGCIMHQLHNVILWAGTGLDHASIPGLPSWIPNWRSISEIGWRHPVDPEWYNADGWLDPFPGIPPPGLPILPPLILRIHGRTCDTVSAVEPAHVPVRSEKMFQICQNILRGLGEDKPYKTGIPVFQALLRTMYLDHEFVEADKRPDFTRGSDSVLVRVLSFLSLILPAECFKEESRALLGDCLEKLGLDPGLSFAKTLKANFWPSGSFNLVTEINFSQMSDDELTNSFPYLVQSRGSLAKLRATPPIRNRGVDVVHSKTGLPIDQQLEERISSWTRAGSRLFRTQSGYLGVGPPGMQEGDVVCVLRRCTTPVLLRRATESGAEFELVGSCFVLGLMEGEALVTVELGADDSANENMGHEKLVDSAEEFLIK